MSQTIDSKVVEMQFDNKNFESNVQTSLSTLDKLKAALNFGDSAKSLEGLGTAASRVNLSGLSGAVETVQAKFSGLQIIAYTALEEITRKAINTGESLIKSLSTDNVSAGWEKFGNKTTSVATLTAQGYALEDVNEQLERLNWFTDETSYNFTDMVSNIAKFTATGQDLNTSVTAMEGIANWAALSGQNATKASQAMYQLSQAMGKGALKYDDYKSIQNASMDTQEFRQHALDAAVALGTLKQTAEGTYAVVGNEDHVFDINQFTEYLSSDAWFTSDVMMKVFSEYSAAVDQLYDFTEAYDLTASEVLSGREAFNKGAEAFDAYCESLGLSAEAKEELAQLSQGLDEFGVKAFESAQKARTWGDVVDSVKDAVSTAWMHTFELLIGNSEEATALFTDMANELYDVFAQPINDLNDLLGEGLGIQQYFDGLGWMNGRELLVQSFWNVWNGLLDTLTLVKEAWRDIFPAKTAEGIQEAIVKIFEFTKKLTLSDETADKLSLTLKGVFSILDIVKNTISAIASGVLPTLGKVIGTVAGKILDLTSKWGLWLTNLNETLKESEVFQKITETISNFLETAFDKIGKVIAAVYPILQKVFNIVKEKIAVPGWELFHSILERIHARLSGVAEGAESVKEKISNVFGRIGEALEKSGFFGMLEKIWGVILKIGAGVGKALGAGFGKLIDMIGNANFNSITDFLNTLMTGGIGVGIFNFIQNLNKGLNGIVGKNGIVGILSDVRSNLAKWVDGSINAKMLKSIAIAIGILAASLLVLSLIDSDKLAGALAAISVLFVELVGAMTVLANVTDGKKVAKLAGTMVAMGVAILLLAGAMKTLSGLSWEDIGKGLVGVAGLAAIMVAVSITLSKHAKKMTKGATAMILFAAAVKILASVCRDLSSLSWEELAKGLAGVGALLAEIDIFMNTANFKGGKAITTATGIVILAAALKILASVASTFAAMKWEDIGKGLVGIGGMLAALAIFTAIAGNAKHALGAGISMLAVVAALKILVGVMKEFGSMDETQIGKGFATIGASLLLIALAVNAMSGAMKGAAALLVVSGALAILAPILGILGAMPIENIGKALLTLAGTFTILGVAGYLLGPVVPVILGLAGALALIGVAVAAVGVGLMAAGAGMVSLAAGLTALAATSTAQASAIVATLKIIINGIIDLIPDIAVRIGEGIVAVLNTLANSADAIGAALKSLVLMAIDVLTECIPDLAEALLQMIVKLLGSLAEHTPEIVDNLVTFLIGVIDGLSARMPELVQAVVNLFTTFFSSIIASLRSLDMGTLENALLGIGIFAGFLAALGALAGLIPGAMLGILGMAGVVAEIGLLFAAFGALKQIPGLTWLIEEGGEFVQTVGNAIGKFIGGIVGGIAEGAADSLPAIGTSLSEFMTTARPFFNGVTAIGTDAFGAVGDLADAILKITATSLLDGIASFVTGSSSIDTFAEQLPKLGEGLSAFSASIEDANFDADKIEASKNLAQMLAALASNDIPTTGGVLHFLTGENDLGVFGEQLPLLATGLKAYCDAIGEADFDADKIEASKNLAQMLGALSSEDIPTTGGVLHWLTGENDLGVFGDQLPTLAEGLSAYAEKIGETSFDSAQIEASKNLASMLASLASEEIPTTGGLLGWLAGDKDLTKFAEQLPVLGEALSAYAASLSDDLTSDKITVSAQAAQMLADLQSTVGDQNNGGFFKSGDLTKFGSNLTTFGSYLNSYYENIKEIDASTLISVIDSVSSMADTISNITEIDATSIDTFNDVLDSLGDIDTSGLSEAISGATGDIETAVTGLMTAFGDAITANGETPKSNMETVVSGLADAFDGKDSSFKSAGSSFVSNLIAGFTEKTLTFTDAVKTMVTNGIAAAKNLLINYTAAGKSLGTGFSTGLKAGLNGASSAASAAASSAASAAGGYYSSFYNSGVNDGQGLVNGLNAMQSAAYAAGYALGAAARKGKAAATDEHSPSREFIKSGIHDGQGLVIGLNSYKDRVYDAGYEMGSAALNGVKKTISRVADIVENGIDAAPTIRPVLDLSSVESGVGTIGDLLALNDTIGFNANLGAITSGMSGRNQNGGNDDIVSAINSLKKSLGGSGDTYNINGVTYDDGSNITEAVRTLIRAARVERRA